MKQTYVITIGRETGSGGGFIGHEVARRLGIECYDKRLIEMACREGGVDLEFMKRAEEKKANPFLYSIPREYQNEKTGRGIPVNDMVFNLESKIIEQLAEEESCVIIGRCADYVLRDKREVYSVFVFSDMESRAKWISRTRSLPYEQAVELIKREQRDRKKYYEYYSRKRWGEKESYHMCLDSGKTGQEFCVEIICSLFRRMADTESY